MSNQNTIPHILSLRSIVREIEDLVGVFVDVRHEHVLVLQSVAADGVHLAWGSSVTG